MNASDKQSAPTMESTLHSEHTQPALGESDVLDRQVADAKAAVMRTLDDVKANLGTAADIRLWTQKYPWLAVGVAAATGFAAASLVTPARKQTLDEKLEELLRSRAEGTDAPHEVKKAAAEASTRGVVMTTILGSLFEILRMAVTNFATAAMRPPVGADIPANGHGDAYADAPNRAAGESGTPDIS